MLSARQLVTVLRFWVRSGSMPCVAGGGGGCYVKQNGPQHVAIEQKEETSECVR